MAALAARIIMDSDALRGRGGKSTRNRRRPAVTQEDPLSVFPRNSAGEIKGRGPIHGKRTLEKANLSKRISPNYWQIGWYTIGMIGVAIMLFLCLRPSCDVRTLGLPNWWIIRWADRHGEFRNYPAFFVLGIPFMVVIRRSRRRALAIGLLAFAGMAVEIVQIWLPQRYASVMDVLWSWAGLATAWALLTLLRSVARKRHIRFFESPTV